jgi:glycosyltransferase involved in cell wall biosynthesis
MVNLGKRSAKILQIGNYPPPMCGWAIQLKLVTEELRRRGHTCEVLKLNEGRKIKSSEYVDVQGGLDYFKKIWIYSWRGYRLNVHVNGMTIKGYWLALAAALVGRFFHQPTLLTFHGGLSQYYFPRHDNSLLNWAFYLLFRVAGGIACDSEPIKAEIERYGIRPEKILAIATFSPQYLDFAPAILPDEIEKFLSSHPHVFLCYVSFRPEYRLEVLREGMRLYRARYPDAGFIWLGFPGKELPLAEQFVSDWSPEERAGLLLLGNLAHNQFLTLLGRCFVCLRTPACDGVCASVLESLALGVPVVASENGRRPPGVITYSDTDAVDMLDKLGYVTEHHHAIKTNLHLERFDDNVGRMADWLTGDSKVERNVDVIAVH